MNKFECSHAHVLRQYLGASDFRVRFLEHCIKCDAQREIKVYFHNRYPDRSPWLWEEDELTSSDPYEEA